MLAGSLYNVLAFGEIAAFKNYIPQYDYDLILRTRIRIPATHFILMIFNAMTGNPRFIY
jgi:hypothetical protein